MVDSIVLALRTHHYLAKKEHFHCKEAGYLENGLAVSKTIKTTSPHSWFQSEGPTNPIHNLPVVGYSVNDLRRGERLGAKQDARVLPVVESKRATT